MRQLLKISTTCYLFLMSDLVVAKTIEQTLKSLALKGQKIMLMAFPIFVIVVAYLYKRGKPEAKERMEGLVIGGILLMTAFAWTSLFK